VNARTFPRRAQIADHFSLFLILRHGNLFVSLDFSTSVHIDKSHAVHYSKLSADQSYAKAQFNYGVMFKNGDGIPIDKSLAAHDFKLSAGQGLVDAQFYYDVLLENGDGIPIDKSLVAHYFKFGY
jgi:TPR repeat protein